MILNSAVFVPTTVTLDKWSISTLSVIVLSAIFACLVYVIYRLGHPSSFTFTEETQHYVWWTDKFSRIELIILGVVILAATIFMGYNSAESRNIEKVEVAIRGSLGENVSIQDLKNNEGDNVASLGGELYNIKLVKELYGSNIYRVLVRPVEGYTWADPVYVGQSDDSSEEGVTSPIIKDSPRSYS